eukprot:m.1178879 g.1178879  ORF g.1178879 m.1178879 type:complete len:71 (+) comp24529_c0_seq2:70-282(+)
MHVLTAADGTVKMDWCGGKEGHACVCTGINCANQTDAFTLRGDPLGEVYTPTFTYHGMLVVCTNKRTSDT